MLTAKDIHIRPIPSDVSSKYIRANHYSGKHVNNSTVHFGCFVNDRLRGVMAFGNPLDRRKMMGLVKDCKYSEFIELNRMVFDESLPKNSESRCISVALRLLKKNAPHINWVISFADGTQCGDGTIYRASGFVLTDIKTNKSLCKLPNGQIIHEMSLKTVPNVSRPELGGRTYFDVTGGSYSFGAYIKASKAKILEGFQLRYIYLYKGNESRLAVKPIPFSEIQRRGAGMYKGIKRATSIDNDVSVFHTEEGGASPTVALHFAEETV